MSDKSRDNVVILKATLRVSELYEFLDRDPEASDSKEIEQYSRAAIEHIPTHYISERINELGINIGPLVNKVNQYVSNVNATEVAERLDALLEIDELGSLSRGNLDDQLVEFNDKVDLLTKNVISHLSDVSQSGYQPEENGVGKVVVFPPRPPQAPSPNTNCLWRNRKLLGVIIGTFLCGIAASLVFLIPHLYVTSNYKEQESLMKSGSLEIDNGQLYSMGAEVVDKACVENLQSSVQYSTNILSVYSRQDAAPTKVSFDTGQPLSKEEFKPVVKFVSYSTVVKPASEIGVSPIVSLATKGSIRKTKPTVGLATPE